MQLENRSQGLSKVVQNQAKNTTDQKHSQQEHRTRQSGTEGQGRRALNTQGRGRRQVREVRVTR